MSGENKHLVSYYLLIIMIVTAVLAYDHRLSEPADFRVPQVPKQRPLKLVHLLCNNVPNIGPFLQRMCIEKTDLYLAVVRGLGKGIKTCQKLFEHERWNCTPKGDPVQQGILGYVMARVSREAAFMYAMASAGITHWVTHECYWGRLSDCFCNSKLAGKWHKDEFKWECDMNVALGMKVSRKVMEDGLLKRDAEALMNRHNSDVGRLAVKHNMALQCKCFGLSGVCTSKTCHKAIMPREELVGRWLKEKYKEAVKVVASRRSNRSGYPKSLVTQQGKTVQADQMHLIYLEESPNYCKRNPEKGSLGTKGRRCNNTNTVQSNSCKLLCCGRGYDTHVQTTQQKCNCKFKWCCEVECEQCKSTCNVYTCK
eukprot:gene6993-7778_t